MEQEPNRPGEIGPKIRYGLIDSVDIFHVKESELDTLESGSPAEVDLNFAIALFSFAFSAVTTILTATFHRPIYQTLYLVIALVGLVLGIYFSFRWWKARTSIKRIIKTIRDRIPTPLPVVPVVVPKKGTETDPTAPKG